MFCSTRYENFYRSTLAGIIRSFCWYFQYFFYELQIQTHFRHLLNLNQENFHACILVSDDVLLHSGSFFPKVHRLVWDGLHVRSFSKEKGSASQKCFLIVGTTELVTEYLPAKWKKLGASLMNSGTRQWKAFLKCSKWREDLPGAVPFLICLHFSCFFDYVTFLDNIA